MILRIVSIVQLSFARNPEMKKNMVKAMITAFPKLKSTLNGSLGYVSISIDKIFD